MFDAEIVAARRPRPHRRPRRRARRLARRPRLAVRQCKLAPVRGGVSADGTQGFTYGYLTVTAGDPARRERKYLAYWVRRPEGWRVVAWRQAPRAAGEPTAGLQPPRSARLRRRARRRPGRRARHQASLAAAEQAFSDRAQQVGLRAAFREYGRDDAVNSARPAPPSSSAPRRSPPAVDARGAATSPVRWSTERSVVASSGDLGVSHRH